MKRMINSIGYLELFYKKEIICRAQLTTDSESCKATIVSKWRSRYGKIFLSDDIEIITHLYYKPKKEEQQEEQRNDSDLNPDK